MENNLLKQREFDLNIEEVLENWEIFHALREIIANALDEQVLTKTKKIEIKRENDFVIIRDFGRGLNYQHLTQNENEEKINNPELVIGKFGVGLKDALATLNRHEIDVKIKTKYGDITLEKRKKHGFDDVVTLHALIDNPSEPDFEGTEFSLQGVTLNDLKMAKKLFLIFSDEKILEKTKYGEILEKTSSISNIYINGVRVAEEENFLFSYNITSMTQSMRKSLNRERTNVGRSAYTDRIKSLLQLSCELSVAKMLVLDLEKFEIGTQHDELKWNDVTVHACKILNASKDVVFVTPREQNERKHLLDYAKGDGSEIVVIPQIIQEKIEGIEDTEGNTIRTVSQYEVEYNESFKFEFIPETELTVSERKIFSNKDKILKIIGSKAVIIKEIKVSETIRVGTSICGVAGMWVPSDRLIIIKRSELSNLKSFSSTLLHEIAHATSGCPDVDGHFEFELSKFLGIMSVEESIK